ncbi:MAG TPA: hypothetical protein VNN18_04170 [Candidatus Xenobia bacterium]|nr:hypothetical protein [Candidatus Xenobia bacterium]
MNSTQQDRWRALLEEFVDARIDAPELLERVATLLPPGADPAEEVLTRLAEGEFKLRPPAGRLAFIRRLEQFAAGEASYAELDLWCFSLWQTEAFAPEAAPIDAETALLQNVLGWIQDWEDEESRPEAATLRELGEILARENDPELCLEKMVEALEGSSD